MNQKPKVDDYAFNMSQNEGAPSSWCVLPWSHISIKRDGQFRVCCSSNVSKNKGLLRNKEGMPFHISKDKWDAILNSEMMKRIRKNMLQGKWSEECRGCKIEYESDMRSSNISKRHYLAHRLKSSEYPNYIKAKKLTKEDGSISLKDFSISYLDIRFGNHCNLKCMMCGPSASNKWYQEYKDIWKDDFFWDGDQKIDFIKGFNGKLKVNKHIYDWSDDSHLWLEIEKYLNQIKKIYLAGGEPLLIKAHYDFLKKCITKKIASEIEINYNSNITHIPDKVLVLWKHFKSICVGMSIDGVGEINELIRYPSDWKEIENNILRLDQIGGNLSLSITSTISVLNIWHLPKFLNYIMKKNYKTINNWNLELLTKPLPLHQPPYLNLNILEDSFKEKIVKYFKNCKEEVREFDWEISNKDNKIKRYCEILDQYINYMYQVKYEEKVLRSHRGQFIYFMDKLDRLRGTNWSKVLPELYESTLEWRDILKLKSFDKKFIYKSVKIN